MTIPLGVAGPLLVNGQYAKGAFMVPLATTEASLVASYHRGAELITALEGCSTLVLDEGVSRTPVFTLKNLKDMKILSEWIFTHCDLFKDLVQETSSYCTLQNIDLNTEGNHLYLLCTYLTGDAAGQNMVTIATQAIFEWILKNTPVTIEYAFVEANMSGDKKASYLAFSSVRGKKVTAEITIPNEMIKKYLHTDARTMQKYWQVSALGSVMSGAIGMQGHYANALGAFYLATGQDIACIAEASVGITRFELKEDDALYVSVTLPNLILGTVGGGTGLPFAQATLAILNLPKKNSARALAEIAVALSLAGEISIIASLCANDFTTAHKKRARQK